MFLRTRLLIMFPTPSVTEIHDGARLRHALEMAQHVAQNVKLLRDGKGLAEWMAKRPTQKQSPRRTNLRRDVSHEADRHGRDAGGFNVSLNQSDGLIA